MNIAPAITPLPAKKAATESSQANTEKAQDGTESTLDGTAFSKLLQGAQQQEAQESLSSSVLAESTLLPVAAEIGTERFSVESLLGQMPGADAFTASLASSNLDAQGTELDVDSLLAQTLRLDRSADAAMRDGSHVLAQPAASLAANAALSAAAGTQPRVAIGQEVATVAAGVQQALGTVSALTSSHEVSAVAATVVEQLGDVTEAMADIGPEIQGKTSSSEGRFTLQGAWTMDEPQTAPSAMLQRLMGQIENWAVSSSGAQPKASERSESSKALQDSASALLYGPGSGTQLTENAVREVQQSATTAFETAQEAPVEDMRFWLQGKQQRAELTLDRDGHPVRVQVSVNGNEAHVTFLSEQQQTRELLDASLAQLREMLAQQGVQLAGVSVQAQGNPQQSDTQSQGGDNGATQQSNAQHARIAVPEVDGRSGGSTQGLDVYA